LPIFGNLFGATIKSTARTELLVVITPRVVRNDVDMKAIGQDMRDRMKGLPELQKPAGFEPSVTEVNAKPVPTKEAPVPPKFEAPPPTPTPAPQPAPVAIPAAPVPAPQPVAQVAVPAPPAASPPAPLLAPPVAPAQPPQLTQAAPQPSPAPVAPLAKKKILKKKKVDPICDQAKKVADDKAVTPCTTSLKGAQL
jgi:hypothetical protein